MTLSLFYNSIEVLNEYLRRLFSEKRDIIVITECTIKVTELGTRQHYRDNVTMFLGHKIVHFCIMSLFVERISIRHRDLNPFRIFRITEALFCCRCR